ncbi:DNA primase [Elioraea thermophila]|uniref:DNA primase n=1 Tax=Elioraea thermophila TaxID=2185104 RepID=UPI000DF49FCB|nr:DNA primase [Elioraea thermophila]
MALPPAFLDELRARIPLGALIGRRVRLTRAGRELKGLCPFHAEKTPSFHVVEDKGFFHCFGCGAHGDAIGFLMRAEGLSFMEAVERLAAEAGLAVPRPTPEAAAAAERAASLSAIAEAAAEAFARRLRLPEGRAALAYLHERGLMDETIALFSLGWSGEGRGALLADLRRQGVTAEQLVAIGLMKQDEPSRPAVDLFFNRVMFPIRDRRGRVIGFGGRVLGEGQPKYLNGPETSLFVKRKTLYGLDLAAKAIRCGASALVVEGYLDVIALHQAGFGGAVAPLGTALTEEQLAELWRLSPEPVLCFDGDAAGARAALRAAELALPLIGPGRSLAFVSLPAGEDPDSLVRRRGPDAFSVILSRRRSLADLLYETIAGEPGPTPEARAAARRRLEELAGRIGDRTLQEEYRRHFRDRWYAELRAKRTVGPLRGVAPRPARPPLAPARTRALRERSLIALILAHPWLLAEAEEALAAERFSAAPLERIRAALVANAGEIAALDPPSVIDHLRESGLGDALEAVLAKGFSDLPQTTLAGATPDEVRTAFLAGLQALDPGRLEQDLAEARARLAAEFTEENVRRLARLVEARERLLAEEHAP